MYLHVMKFYPTHTYELQDFRVVGKCILNAGTHSYTHQFS